MRIKYAVFIPHIFFGDTANNTIGPLRILEVCDESSAPIWVNARDWEPVENISSGRFVCSSRKKIKSDPRSEVCLSLEQIDTIL